MADSPLWTSDEIAAATGGAPTGDAFAVTGISFDTREIQPGDLFLALAGERDGHDFARAAFDKGAAGALVSRPVEGGPSVQVADTLKGLEALGVAARDRSQARRIAVTGSVGKTSVTQALLAGLRLAGATHGSVKSFNNHIGVPLTLARMPKDTEFAVFEIGMNHAEEIRPLSKLVKPQVAVVTAVGPVHTENFADGEAGVARAKAEIFDGLERWGVAVLDADGAWFELLSQTAREHDAAISTFGTVSGVDAQLLPSPSRGEGSGMGVSSQSGRKSAGGASPAKPGKRGANTPTPDPSPLEGEESVFCRYRGRTLRFPIAQPGAHWRRNAMAVLLAMEAVGVPVQTGIEALASFAPLAGRGAETRVALGDGGFMLIDESYNANPVSMRAAIDTLAHRSGRKLAVLTDMLELGPQAQDLHADLARPLQEAGVDLVFAAGPLMKNLYDALPKSMRGAYADTASALAPEVRAAVRDGDVVMAKGSNGSKASLVVRALERMGPSPGGKT